jgi:hypothetical protein
MKTAQSITDILHQKSDLDLKAYIDGQLLPLFEMAKGMPYRKLASASPCEWERFKNADWIGDKMKDFRDLAFLYLRDDWRSKSVTRFISKVEEIENLSQEFTHDHQ